MYGSTRNKACLPSSSPSVSSSSSCTILPFITGIFNQRIYAKINSAATSWIMGNQSYIPMWHRLMTFLLPVFLTYEYRGTFILIYFLINLAYIS